MRIGFVMCIAYSPYELLALFLFLKSDYNTGNTCRNDETKERTRGHIHEWTGIDHPIFGVDGIPVCDHCALQDESVFLYDFRCNCNRSAIMAINSELVGLPLALETV